MFGKMGKEVLGGFLILLIWGFWVAGRAAEPPALARLSGAEKERVAKLIEGAKKEGALIGYSSSLRPDVQTKMIPLFMKAYGFSESDLKVKIVSTRTGAIVTKITEELRAKVYKTDVVQNATIDWFNDLIARGEILAYNSPEFKHFHPISTDPEIGPNNPPYYVPEKFSVYGLLYNPKFIKEEIVHWRDVLRPQYKGKIACGDVSRSFSYTEVYLAIRKVLGVSYFEELAKLDPFLLVSASDLINKSITGEYPIVLISSNGTAFRSNLKGAGLKLVFPPEGWAAVGSGTVILARAPHPNAAKLWIDFVHSEVGQNIWLNFACHPTSRLGVKSEYPGFPAPIYEIKGAVPIDWRKITTKDRDDAREEFRRIMMGKKK